MGQQGKGMRYMYLGKALGLAWLVCQDGFIG